MPKQPKAQAAVQPKPVAVRSLEWHTHKGKAYPPGKVYEIEAEMVDSIILQRKAELASTKHLKPAKARKVKPATKRRRK